MRKLYLALGLVGALGSECPQEQQKVVEQPAPNQAVEDPGKYQGIRTELTGPVEGYFVDNGNYNVNGTVSIKM